MSWPTSSFNTTPLFGQPAQQQQTTNPFGSSTQQQQGFGQQPQQTTPSVFGGSTFGQPQQQQQTTGGLWGQPQQQPTTGPFGSSVFGQVQAQPQQTGFSGFGQPQATTSLGGQQGQATTAFGQPQQQQQTFTGFGAAQPQQQTSFLSGFGQTQPSQPQKSTPFSWIGQPQPQQQQGTGFTGFGQPQQQQQQPSTSFSAFGQPQTTNAFGGFGTGTGFGQPQQPATTSFAFPQPTTTTASGLNFNTGSAIARPLFSFAPVAAKPPPPTNAPFSFSTPSFGQPSTTFPNFAPAQQPFQLGQPTSFSLQPQQQPSFQFQQPAAGQPLQFQQPGGSQTQTLTDHQNQAFYQSIFQCHKFGDERDKILAHFNYLQAGWGRGKGHYSQTLPPVTYTTSNPLYRFKAVSYAFIQTETNEEGHVTMDIKKTEEKVRQEEANLITALQNMIGHPNTFYKVSGIKRLEENLTRVNICAEDRTTLRRIPAIDLTNALSQPHLKGHLDNLLIEKVVAKIRPSPEQLKRYLEDAPQGLDPRVWKQAQEDNPDPEHMIPVPIIGAAELKKRATIQESESQQHITCLARIEEDIRVLQNRHTNMTAELQQLRAKESELAHRLLKVVLRQEVTRMDGTTIQPEEEQLNTLLLKLETKINTPAQFRGKLNELLSRARLKLNGDEGNVKYTLDDETLRRIKQILQIQQEAIQSCATTIQDDVDQLKNLNESLNTLAEPNKMSNV